MLNPNEQSQLRRTARAMTGLLWIALLLSACGGIQVEPTPYPSDVDWETAVEILNAGEVEMVAQLHSLDVILTLKDGTEIHTVEPTIDAIFQEVEKCGQPCSQIMLATE
jgi:hypothetical protein